MDRNLRYDNNLNQGYANDEKLSDEYIEEMGTEFAPALDMDDDRAPEAQDELGAGYWFGLIALALAILSLFTASTLMAVIGLILAFVARARGATSMGNWAIGISCAAIIIDLFFTPVFFL